MIRKQEVKLKGIIIKQDILCELLLKIEKYYKRYNITVRFIDGSSLEKVSIKELKKFNFSNRKIDDVDIRFHDDEDFFNEFYLDKPISGDYRIVFSHDKEDIYAIVKEIIENWVVENTQRKIIKFIHSFWFVFVSSLLFCMPIMLMLGIESVFLPAFIYFGIMIASMSIFICYGLWCFAKFIYPLVEIDIGINRHKKLRKSLGWILTVIVIPTIIAIILEIVL